jgi:hypothetical protein
VINLRYHIVSITAVFLALGIGLTLGSTFLDRVTVDNLKSQLEDVSDKVDQTKAENALLSHRVDGLDDSDEELSKGLSRLVAGHLTDVPLLLIAAEGTDEDEIDDTMATLRESGAEVAGVWWLTERWDLDEDADVDALRGALGRISGSPEDLRASTAASLASILQDGTATPTVPQAGETPPEPTQPELVEALAQAGFLEYEDPSGGDDTVVLPDGAARYLVVSDAPAEAGATQLASELVLDVAEIGDVPLLAAQGDTDLEDDEGNPAPEDERRTTFVGPFRDDGDVRDAISTLDDLDRAAGLFGSVLALEDLGEGVVGHYGIGKGADSLLPGPAPG